MTLGVWLTLYTTADSPQLSETSAASFQTLTAPAPIRRTASYASNVNVDDETVDAREIDKVLTEVAAMAGRWSLFRKFLYERLQVRIRCWTALLCTDYGC